MWKLCIWMCFCSQTKRKLCRWHCVASSRNLWFDFSFLLYAIPSSNDGIRKFIQSDKWQYCVCRVLNFNLNRVYYSPVTNGKFGDFVPTYKRSAHIIDGWFRAAFCCNRFVDCRVAAHRWRSMKLDFQR